MKILVDTSYIYGLLVQKSINHRAAQTILDKILLSGSDDQFITLNYVVQESYSVFSIRVHDATYLDALDDLIYGKNSFFEIIYMDSNSHIDGAIIQIIKDHLLEKPRKTLSFVDASLIYYGEQSQIDGILAFDSHFDTIIPSYPFSS
ncbi:MAG TPA: hypothetical protein VKM55_08340 [Candidatus Lokiarchaeia archaeon]|nr:hypothetical protein [Candidatus Lokiarchaeia archaeon]